MKSIHNLKHTTILDRDERTVWLTDIKTDN